MRTSEHIDPGGEMARVKGTRNKDSKIGKKTPKLKSQAYKKGIMTTNKPRGILKDNY
jgi:hypothetical protein